MTANTRAFCCTTPRAICFWAVIFLLLYGGALLLTGMLPALQSYRGVLLFAALGVACLANFAKNRTFHCAVTGPIFLAAGTLATLSVSGFWNLSLVWLWPAVLLGVGVALLLEFRIAARLVEASPNRRREGDEK